MPYVPDFCDPGVLIELWGLIDGTNKQVSEGEEV